MTVTIDEDGDGSGDGEITSTAGHAYWTAETVDGDGYWAPARDLVSGAWLRTSSGTWVQATVITAYTTQTHTYNLTVANHHTYYIQAGTTDALVHNCGSGAKDGAGLSDQELLDAAAGLRDNFIEEASWGSNRKRPATVTAGYNVETRQYAAGGSFRGACAEMCVVAQLGGDASMVRFTTAVRPSKGNQVPICMVCEIRYGRSAFVQHGTEFLSDFFTRFY